MNMRSKGIASTTENQFWSSALSTARKSNKIGGHTGKVLWLLFISMEGKVFPTFFSDATKLLCSLSRAFSILYGR
jgi:hypothetical protein